MANSNHTRSRQFIQQQFLPAADLPNDVKLAKQPLTVKVPIGIDQAIRNLGDQKAAWLRKAICQAALEDGLVDEIQ